MSRWATKLAFVNPSNHCRHFVSHGQMTIVRLLVCVQHVHDPTRSHSTVPALLMMAYTVSHDGCCLSIILPWCPYPDIKPHAEPYVYKAHPKSKPLRIRKSATLAEREPILSCFPFAFKRLKVRLLLTRCFSPALPCQLHTVRRFSYLARPPTAFNPTAKLATLIVGHHKTLLVSLVSGQSINEVKLGQASQCLFVCRPSGQSLHDFA